MTFRDSQTNPLCLRVRLGRILLHHLEKRALGLEAVRPREAWRSQMAAPQGRVPSVCCYSLWHPLFTPAFVPAAPTWPSRAPNPEPHMPFMLFHRLHSTNSLSLHFQSRREQLQGPTLLWQLEKLLETGYKSGGVDRQWPLKPITGCGWTGGD